MVQATDQVSGKRGLPILVLALILCLAALLAACSTGKPTPVIPPPSVAITSPVSGSSVQAGVDVSINSTANDAQGILRTELWVDGSLYRVDVSPEPGGQTTFVVSQPWNASVPGSHTMVVKAHSKSGQVAESAPVVINVLASVVILPTNTPIVARPTDTPPVATDTPPPSATDTLSPLATDTPLPPSPTDTPTAPTPELTDTPEPTDTLEPTDTPIPTDTPVLPDVPEPFARVWAAADVRERLGNPAGDAVLDRWVADQFFEGGLTYWRNNEGVPANYIYVLPYKGGTDDAQGTTWMRFEDLWREGMPEFSCSEAEANGDHGPKRGFGKVWCEEATVHAELKSPLVVEQGAQAGFQDFENGTMLWVGRVGYIYVLYSSTRDWQRFDDRP